MKKLYLVISLILMLGICFVLSSCGGKNSDELEFFLKDDGTYVVEIGEAKYRSEIEIPSKHKGKTVTEIGAFGHSNSALEKITIPDSITKIGANAFSGCTALTSVTIPDNVTEIGANAFANCTALTSVTIPDSVNKIGAMAFYNCDQLERVTIGNGVTKIESYAFYGCSNIVSISLGNGVKEISSEAFTSNDKMVEVINHSSLNIEKGSSEYAGIAKNALEVHKGNTKIINKDNYLFYTVDDFVYLIGYVGNDTELTFPDSYNGKKYQIYKYAFHNSDSITRVSVSDGVTSIGDRAFYDCSKLTEVTLGKSVSTVGSYAFYYCKALTSVNIPSNVTEIKYSAFGGCSSLTNVVIQKGVTKIGNHAFSGCSTLVVVCYTGTEKEWKSIEMDSSYSGLEDIFIRYNYGK